jgi:putative (di)nucleoside polyphosphate hydrolase
MIIANHEGNKLFWGKRVGPHDAWQFPQGGILKREAPEAAMYRELSEELGLKPLDVKLVAMSKQWLSYRLPSHLLRHHSKPLCIGQRQRWFLLQLVSDEENICFDSTGSPEFIGWRWVKYWEPLKQVIDFKRQVYKDALQEFEPLLKSMIPKSMIPDEVGEGIPV